MTRITFGRQVLGDLVASTAREWLVTDGLGGYAMGTVAGLRTRRYHGLLVVARDRPGERRVGLVALDAVLVVGDQRIRLATDEWVGGAVDPVGNQHLARFDLRDGVPTWQWSVNGVVIEREIGRHLQSLSTHTNVRILMPSRRERQHLSPKRTGNWKL